MADFSLNVKINGVEQAVTTVSQIEEALIATRNELKNVAIGSSAFDQLSKQAQTLQREFVNSYKETTNFNKGIAELGQSMGSLASTVTAGFTIATTAFSMFGDETQELSETQVKAQQALSLALAATTLATNAKTIAEDINNVGLALQNGLTKLLTLALGANTVATAAQAVATGTATVAQRALNAAMSANPIGLVIAAVAALVSAFFFLGKEEKKTVDTTELYNEALDRNSAAIRENIATAKELAVLEGRLAEASAKTDEGKLNAKIETQKRLTELNKQD
jgi:predicted PurR-regulated permease PerM